MLFLTNYECLGMQLQLSEHFTYPNTLRSQRVRITEVLLYMDTTVDHFTPLALRVRGNNTAGLEAVLTLAVGARVMLRRNVNVKSGLVNGAIGTVVAISPTCIAVKFDHLTDTRRREVNLL